MTEKVTEGTQSKAHFQMYSNVEFLSLSCETQSVCSDPFALQNDSETCHAVRLAAFPLALLASLLLLFF